MNPSLKPVFRQLDLLYYSIGIGIIVIGLSSYLAQMNIDFSGSQDFRWLTFAGPISGLAFIVLSQAAFSKMVSLAKKCTELSEAIGEYKKALIIRWVILDFAAILNLLCYMVTGDFLFILLALAILIVYFLQKASLKKLIYDLELDPKAEKIVRGE